MTSPIYDLWSSKNHFIGGNSWGIPRIDESEISGLVQKMIHDSNQGKKPRDPYPGMCLNFKCILPWVSTDPTLDFFSWLWSPSADLRNISYKITRTHDDPNLELFGGSAEAHVLFTYWLFNLQSSKCYPPRNYHIPSKGSWEDEFPSPLVRYVSSLESSNLGFVSNWKTEVLQWPSVYVSRFPWRMV